MISQSLEEMLGNPEFEVRALWMELWAAHGPDAAEGSLRAEGVLLGAEEKAACYFMQHYCHEG